MDLYYDNTIFAQNLKEQMERKGMSGADLSKMLDCSKSIITDWLKGRKLPRMDKVDKMCIIFNCKREDLIEPPKSNEDNKVTGFPLPPDTAPIKITGFIPVYGEIPAGFPNFEEEVIIDFVSTSFNNPDEYFALKVKGDSMINAGIPDGAYVTLHKQNCAQNNNIVACRINNEEVTLKRFRQRGETVVLMPENPAYEPIIVSVKDFEEGSAQILGVVKEIVIKM